MTEPELASYDQVRAQLTPRGLRRIIAVRWNVADDVRPLPPTSGPLAVPSRAFDATERLVQRLSRL
jgi:hypothetical protein